MNAAIHAYTRAHAADEIVAACVDARVPAAIVGNGAELPRNEQLAARDVFVRAAGRVVDPAARAVPVPRRRRSRARRAAVRRGRLVAATVAARADAPAPTAATGRSPGLRVLDFTAFWAGPFATAWLSSMGADVVKVEAVQRPDGIRFSATVRPHDDPQFYEKSALFHACNLGKRGITLDLGHPDGLAIAKRLVARSDVVAENFTPQVLERFGLDWDTVHALNPEAIMLRMPAFGLDGPWRARGGFAQTMEQLTGMAWVTGYEGGPPIIPGGPVDPMVGAHAALAVVAALEHRTRTGRGQLVEVPLVEVATAVTAEQVIRYAIDGTLLERRGAGGVYRCAGDDAWVAIDRDRDPMAPDERARVVRDPHRRRRRARRAARRASPRRRWSPGYATLDDPQMRARGFFEPVDNPLVGEQHYPTWPVRLSGGPDRVWTAPAPTLGQHNAEVLRDELGIDDDELARLEAEHVIGTRPSTEPVYRRDEPSVGCSAHAAPTGGPELEDVEDALVDGDVAYQRGTAAAALRHRDFRIVYVGTFASNIGTWMQNVILGVYALEAHGQRRLRRPVVLRPARAAAVPLDDGRRARRPRRPPAPARRRCRSSQGALSFGLACVAWSAASVDGRDRRHRVRDRDRERARRARAQRDPARRSCRGKTSPARSRSRRCR